MKKIKEKMDPKDFFDFPKHVRDAAEKIYDLFERDTLNNILKGKEKPSMWRNITSQLSPKEAEQATELAFAWAAEDSMSSSRFPEAAAIQNIYESIGKEMKTITIKEEMRIPGTNIILEEGDSIRVLESSGETEYLIKSLRKVIPWDDKPEKYVQSASHELSGTVNGTRIVFNWHQPGRYGDYWLFLGLSVGIGKYDSKEMFEWDSTSDFNDPTSSDRLKQAMDFVRKM